MPFQTRFRPLVAQNKIYFWTGPNIAGHAATPACLGSREASEVAPDACGAATLAPPARVKFWQVCRKGCTLTGPIVPNPTFDHALDTRIDRTPGRACLCRQSRSHTSRLWIRERAYSRRRFGVRRLRNWQVQCRQQQTSVRCLHNLHRRPVYQHTRHRF